MRAIVGATTRIQTRAPPRANHRTAPLHGARAVTSVKRQSMSNHFQPPPRIARARSPRTDNDNSNRASREDSPREAAGQSRSRSRSPARASALSLKRDQMLPFLRKLRPTFVFTNDRALLNLCGGGLNGATRPCRARAEVFNPLGLSVSCSVSATQLARFLHVLVHTPLAVAGLLLAAKSLVERSQRLREEREAREAWRVVEVEPAIPSDMGVEHALAMSIPLENDRLADDDEDEDEVSMAPSDWSFISDEFQDDASDSEVIDR